jgi:hypothetical protein
VKYKSNCFPPQLQSFAGVRGFDRLRHDLTSLDELRLDVAAKERVDEATLKVMAALETLGRPGLVLLLSPGRGLFGSLGRLLPTI